MRTIRPCLTRTNTKPAIDSNYSLPSGAAGGASHQTSSLLDEFARKRKAAAIAVPTDDKRVRTELRSRGEPITLFGERPEDRRDRLRAILYSEQEGGGEDEDMRDVSDASDDDGDEADSLFIEMLKGAGARVCISN